MAVTADWTFTSGIDADVGGWIGTPVGDPVVEGGALVLAGADYITTDYPGITGTADRTIRIDFNINAGTDAGLLHYGADAGGPNYSRFSLNVEDGDVYLRHLGGAQNWSGSWNDGENHVLHLTFGSGTLELFIDGASQGARSVPLDTGTGHDLQIGRDRIGGIDFAGSIYRVTFHDEILAASTIEAQADSAVFGLAGNPILMPNRIF